MGIVLGLVAAVLYGSGDFAGGRAAEGRDVRRVLLVSQGAAVVLALPLVFIVHGELIGPDLLRGAGAGLLNALGLGFLYRALAIGRASVVAPLCAVMGAVVPVAYGLTTGERPGGRAFIGVVFAVGAAALLARGNDDHDSGGAGAALALAAGAALGTGFVCFAATTDASGLWPVLAQRVAGASAAGLALALAGGTLALSAASRRFALIAAACDVAASVALLSGLREELAVFVAALAALAPGFTVLCAWLFARERVARHQLAGVALALVGLALIAAR